MLVQLTHNSGVKGAEGVAGTIVDAKDEQAQQWLSDGGAVPAPAGAKKGDQRDLPSDAPLSFKGVKIASRQAAKQQSRPQKAVKPE